MPNQAVFRQKPWLPRWIALLVLLLILLALLLFLLLPRNVAVPGRQGQEVVFEASRRSPRPSWRSARDRAEGRPKRSPARSSTRRPAPGEKVKKQSLVHVVTAVGTGKRRCPNVVGKTLAEAEHDDREEGLTVGAVNPQPPDPEGKVKSQIPPAGEIAKEGKPIQLFLETAGDKKKGGDETAATAAAAAVAVAAARRGGHAPARSARPTPRRTPQKAADAGLTPVQADVVLGHAKAGELFGTDPPGGTEVKAGSEVKLLVSAGFPQIAYDNGKDVLLVNGADGKRLGTIAKSPRIEKEPDASGPLDGSAIASRRWSRPTVFSSPTASSPTRRPCR